MKKDNLESQYEVLEKAFEDGALDCSWWMKWKEDNGYGSWIYGEWSDKDIQKVGTEYKPHIIPYEEGKRLWDESNPKSF